MFLRQTLWTVPPITPLGATITGAIVLALYLAIVPLIAAILAAVDRRLEALHAARVPRAPE